jgi:hypothetical protein
MNHEKPRGDEAKCTMNIGPTGRLKSSHEIATISLAGFDRSHPGEHLYHQPSRRYFVGTELPWISNAAITSIALEDPSSLAVSPPHVITLTSSSFPVLLDVKGPLELQMGVVVIVDELGDGLVMTTAEHARGSGFGFDCEGCQSCAGMEKRSSTYTSSRRMASPRCWDHMNPVVVVSQCSWP